MTLMNPILHRGWSSSLGVTAQGDGGGGGGGGGVIVPKTPCLKVPRAKETWVEVGPGMHWQRARSSRKIAEENQFSLSTNACIIRGSHHHQ